MQRYNLRNNEDEVEKTVLVGVKKWKKKKKKERRRVF